MSSALILFACVCTLAAAQWAVLGVTPWPLPIETDVAATLDVTYPLDQTSTVIEHWIPSVSGVSSFSSGGAANFTYNVPALLQRLSVTLSSSAQAGLGSLRIAPGSVPFPVRYYVPPRFAQNGAVPSEVNSTGLTPVKLYLADSTQTLPTASLHLLSLCHAPTVTALPALITAFPVRLNGAPALTVDITELSVRMEIVNGATVTTVVMQAPAVPSATCKRQRLYASYNDRGHYHDTNLTLTTIARDPIKVVSLYPFTIGNSPWVAAHNEARIQASTEAIATADFRTYYEESWRVPALNSGRLVDVDFFQRAIQRDNATLLILAGTQYNASTFAFVDRNPNVNFLMMSTLRRVLPFKPNVAFATGRMYEAMFYAGYVAASVSKTGYMGFIMSLLDPGSFAFLNAFKRGVDACVEAGQAGFTPSSAGPFPSPRVFGRIIGAFADDWAERNAALELVYPAEFGPSPGNPPVDILFPVTDNISPQQVCHSRASSGRGAPCYTLGFNADERAMLGDFVLTSAVFKLYPVYMQFIRRVAAGTAFGQSTFDAGLGSGVDLTVMSPLVSLDVQAEVNRRLAVSKSNDALEEIFCSYSPNQPLVDANGVVLLNSSGFVAPGLTAERGEGGAWCLSRADVYRHTRLGARLLLMGVDTPLAVYRPPPQPTAEQFRLEKDAPAVYAAALFLGTLILAVSVAASLMILFFRKYDVIRFSSPLFLLIICGGGIVTGAGVLFSVLTPNAALTVTDCNMRLWLEGTGFCLLYGSLFAKTYRVHRLFNNKKLKRLRLNVWYVIRIIATLLTVEVGVLLALSLLSRPTPDTVLVPGMGNSLGTTHVTCRSQAGSADTDTILQALHFLVLVWGAYLAYSTRNVPLGFNESRYIGFSIYNVAIATIIGFALAAGSESASSPSLIYTVNLIHMAVPAAATLLLLFLPKGIELAAIIICKRRSSEEEDETPVGPHVKRPGAQQQMASSSAKEMKPSPWLCCCVAVARCLAKCAFHAPTGAQGSRVGVGVLAFSGSSSHELFQKAVEGGSAVHGSFTGSFQGSGLSKGSIHSPGGKAVIASPSGHGSGGLGRAGGKGSKDGLGREGRSLNAYPNVKAASVVPGDMYGSGVPITDVLSEEMMDRVAGTTLAGGAHVAGVKSSASVPTYTAGELGRAGRQGSIGRTRREPERGVIGPGNPTITGAHGGGSIVLSQVGAASVVSVAGLGPMGGTTANGNTMAVQMLATAGATGASKRDMAASPTNGGPGSNDADNPTLVVSGTTGGGSFEQQREATTSAARSQAQADAHIIPVRAAGSDPSVQFSVLPPIPSASSTGASSSSRDSSAAVAVAVAGVARAGAGPATSGIQGDGSAAKKRVSAKKARQTHAALMQQLAQGGAITFDGGELDDAEDEHAGGSEEGATSGSGHGQTSASGTHSGGSSGQQTPQKQGSVEYTAGGSVPR